MRLTNNKLFSGFVSSSQSARAIHFVACKGFDHFPLSLPTFRTQRTTPLCSPLDEDFGLLPQSEQPITCLPYTRSPLALPKAVRSMSFEQAKIDSTLRVEPDSIRFPLVSQDFTCCLAIDLLC